MLSSATAARPSRKPAPRSHHQGRQVDGEREPAADVLKTLFRGATEYGQCVPDVQGNRGAGNQDGPFQRKELDAESGGRRTEKTSFNELRGEKLFRRPRQGVAAGGQVPPDAVAPGRLKQRSERGQFIDQGFEASIGEAGLAEPDASCVLKIPRLRLLPRRAVDHRQHRRGEAARGDAHGEGGNHQKRGLGLRDRCGGEKRFVHDFKRRLKCYMSTDRMRQAQRIPK